jgi:hypothetical protein
MERLPAETALTETTRRFKSIRRETHPVREARRRQS